MTLESSLVRIYSRSGKVIGAGFLVSQNRVLTCAHVVASALGIAPTTSEMPADSIRLDFPRVALGQQLTAKVVFWRPVHPNPSTLEEFEEDIAGLELATHRPNAAQPVRWALSENLWGHHFRVLGFPEGNPNGVWASGALRGQIASGWVQLEAVTQTGYRLERGFSGAPVWDQELQGVVGMAVAADMNRSEVRAAFIIPTNRLLEAWTELGERAIPSCPYRGLYAFREEDAPFFFGRKRFTDELVEAVQKQPLVAVIGPSGSGKSSVVFAGLIPRLRVREETWYIASFRTSDRPLHALAAALIPLLEPQMRPNDRLRRTRQLAADLWETGALRDTVEEILGEDTDTQLLLVADQFEELYTLRRDDPECLAFLNRLLEAVNYIPSFTLVLTLRADFLAYVLSDPLSLRDVLQQFPPKLLGPMTPKELKVAIEEPAKKKYVKLQEDLTQRILDDVDKEPGNLPLLEFTLTQLWKKQSNGQLTHSAYKEIGYVKKALANHAEEVYKQLSQEEQQQAQRIFIQLVRPGEGTEDTRRLATRAQVGEDKWKLVTKLAGSKARLVVTGRNKLSEEETVEIVHEALIREWPQLRDWMDANRRFRTWQDRLRSSREQWKTKHRDEGALQRGALLAESQNWLKERQADLSEDDQNYINLSLELEKRERDERDRLNRNFIQRLSIVVVVAVIVAVVAIGQFLQVRKANDNIFAHSLLDRAEVTRNQPNLLQFSVGLGLEAIDLSKSVELKPFLYNDLALLPPSYLIDNDRGSVNAVAFSKMGKYLATAGLAEKIGSDGYTCIGEETGENKNTSYSLKKTALSILSILFDGEESGDNKSTSYRNKQYCVPGEKSVNAVAFSPDENHLATASADGKVCVGDKTETGWKFNNCINHNAKDDPTVGANAVSFSPDGNYLATAWTDGQVRMFRKTSTNNYNPLSIGSSPHSASVIAITFSPDSKLLVTASLDGKAYVWDLANKDIKPKTLPQDHNNGVNAVAFSPPDSKYLATVSSDREIHVWNLTKKAIVYSMKHEGGVVDVAFSPDGKHLATASLDGTAHLWRDWKTIKTDESDKTEESEFKKSAVNLRHGGPVTDVAFSPDSKYLATASSDNTARIWEVTSGYEFARLSHKDGVNAIAFTEVKKPHQNYPNYLVATASLDGTARVWEINSERTVALMRHNEPVNAMALNHKRKQVATATIKDELPRIWSAASGHQENFWCKEPKKEPPSSEKEPSKKKYVKALTFSKDDNYLATININNQFSVWQWDENKTCWKSLKQNLGKNVNSVAFSPDNIHLATASFLNNYAQLWQIRGNEQGTKLEEHEQSVTSVTFSKNGQYLATASRDKTARLWKVSTDNQPVNSFGCVQHEAFVEAVAFSPDSKYLATASTDGKVNVSNITKITSSNQLGCQNSPSNLPQQNGPVTSVVFSPPDQEKNSTYSYLVTVSVDNTAKVWKVPDKSNKPVATMKHDQPVTAVAFSPDNQHLATASKDQTVRIWEITSGKLVETILHGGPVTTVDFISLNNDNKGERLATMSGDNTARVLLWKRQELIERACTHLTMNRPTEGEWQQYVGDNEQYRKSWVCDSK